MQRLGVSELTEALEHDPVFEQNTAQLGHRLYRGEVKREVARNVRRWLVRSAIARYRRSMRREEVAR